MIITMGSMHHFVPVICIDLISKFPYCMANKSLMIMIMMIYTNYFVFWLLNINCMLHIAVLYAFFMDNTLNNDHIAILISQYSYRRRYSTDVRRSNACLHVLFCICINISIELSPSGPEIFSPNVIRVFVHCFVLKLRPNYID